MNNREGRIIGSGVVIALLLVLAMTSFTQSTVYRIRGNVANDVSITGTPSAFTFTKATGDQTNQAYVTVSTRDKSGQIVPGGIFDFWWSDSATCSTATAPGSAVTATASSGSSGLLVGVGAGTSNGTLFFVTAATPTVATSRIPMRIGSDSAGNAKIGVIDSAKTLYVPCASSILSGPKAGAALVTGNYK